MIFLSLQEVMKRDTRATQPLRWHSLISGSILPIPHDVARFLVLTLIMIPRRAVQPHEAEPESSQPDEQVEDGWRLTLLTMQEAKRQDWEWALRKWILPTCSGIRLCPVRNPSQSSSGDYHRLILFHKEIHGHANHQGILLQCTDKSRYYLFKCPELLLRVF